MAWKTGFLYTDNYAGLNVANAPFSDYTHIVISYVAPNADGSIDTSQENLSDVATIVSMGHAAGCKVITGVGEVTSGNWKNATTSGNRANFVSNLVNYINAHGLDGADLDYEQQIVDSQYAAFIQDLRAALGPSKIITVSAYGG